MPARSRHHAHRASAQTGKSGLLKIIHRGLLLVVVGLFLATLGLGLWILYLPVPQTPQSWLLFGASDQVGPVKVLHYDPGHHSLQELNLTFYSPTSNQVTNSRQLTFLINQQTTVDASLYRLDDSWSKWQLLQFLGDQFIKTRQQRYLSLAKSVWLELDADEITSQEFASQDDWIEFLSKAQFGFNQEQCSIAVINTTQIPALANDIAYVLSNSDARIVRTGNNFINLDTDVIEVAESTQDKCRDTLEKVTQLFSQPIPIEVNQSAKTIYRADIVIFVGKEISDEWAEATLQ